MRRLNESLRTTAMELNGPSLSTVSNRVLCKLPGDSGVANSPKPFRREEPHNSKMGPDVGT
jgi:hypothetical protein